MKPNTLRALGGALATLAAATALAAPALAGPKPNAMTWQTFNYETLPDAGTNANIVKWNTIRSQNPHAVFVGCHSTPKCDAYNGDKPETEKRPILCFKPGTAPEPAGWPALFGGPTGGVRPDWQFYRNWSGGNVGLSKEYFGTALTSQAISDAHCAADVGPGYRMAEHHDNGVGGWAFGAQMEPDGTGGYLGHFDGRLKWGHHAQKLKRFWVRVNDQTANTYD